MKLLRIGAIGAERPAVLLDDVTAVDVSSIVGDYDSAFFAGSGLDDLARLAPGFAGLPRLDLAGVRIGSPLTRPGKIVCIGLNYRDHATEAGMDPPAEPIVFAKAPNTVVGPYDDVRIPPGSVKTDWEVELGVVIGSTCRYLASPDDALAAVAGYCTSNDVSEREYQLERGGQWDKGKSCETFNPLGPWLVTADEVPAPNALELGLDLNGIPMQRGSTQSMIFDVAYLIWYLSQFMVLEPGDLVNTGTPSGVGMSTVPPRFVGADDIMEPWITGLGRQRSMAVQTVLEPIGS